MKKVLFVAAAAGLMSVAACTSETATTNESNTEMAVEALENVADNYEAMADNATTDNAEMALENAADAADAAADNVEDNAM